MAEWTDEWLRALPMRPGKPPKEFRDPLLSGHRLVVGAASKIFEIQRERPSRFGPRKTWKVKVGGSPPLTIEQARAIAYQQLALIAQGKDPREATAGASGQTTLKAAYERFTRRKGIATSTLAGYESLWRRHLSPTLGNETLHALVMNPQKAEKLHADIVAAGHPTDANRALKLLRAIYLDAARGDPSLPMDRNPTSGLHRRWAKEKPREAAIPFAEMPAWNDQVEALREISPLRASFHMLCLLIGTRPGFLARAKREDFDQDRQVLSLPQDEEIANKPPYEVPLSKQALKELKRALEASETLAPNSPFIFPANSLSGHLEKFGEPKHRLSQTGNSGRHSFKTIATAIGINDLHSDVLQGRSLLKANLAGRGYIGRSELTEPLRAAAQKIGDEIQRLLNGGATEGARQSRAA